MATAVNEWQLARWCDPDPRLKAAVLINVEHEKSAIAEIEKRAGDRRFVQVQIPPRGLEPLGRRRYWPILEACAANGLPISLHLGGTSGHASTGGGHPSFYHEEHPSYVQTMQTLVTSLVCEGVFEHIPNLRSCWSKAASPGCRRCAGGWTSTGKRLRAEVPYLKRQPSEYVRTDIWLTTQPIEEPERPQDMLSTWNGSARPHHVLDRLSALGSGRSAVRLQGRAEERKRKIYHDNALAFYGLE